MRRLLLSQTNQIISHDIFGVHNRKGTCLMKKKESDYGDKSNSKGIVDIPKSYIELFFMSNLINYISLEKMNFIGRIMVIHNKNLLSTEDR